MRAKFSKLPAVEAHNLCRSSVSLKFPYSPPPPPPHPSCCPVSPARTAAAAVAIVDCRANNAEKARPFLFGCSRRERRQFQTPTSRAVTPTAQRFEKLCVAVQNAAAPGLLSSVAGYRRTIARGPGDPRARGGGTSSCGQTAGNRV